MELINIIKKLKSKKELKNIDEGFVKARILEYLSKNKIDLDNEKSKSHRLMFKFLRKQLREVYGVFRIIKETRNLGIYKKIFQEFKPKSVLDLGCGLEPLSYVKIYDAKYYCADLDKEEINKINGFFNKNNIDGKAFIFSLVDDDLEKLPKVDLCLILKVIESLESVKRNFSKELLRKIKAKVIIVSFARIALGKTTRIKKSGRSWFRRILKELNYNYKIFDSEDEIFFVIKKL